jgi:hypothetical protein
MKKLRRVNHDLFDAFAAAMPLTFLEGVKSVMHQLYEEAHHAMHQDPLLGSPEAAYATPHYRRALIETRLRQEAQKSGLAATVQTNSAQSAEFTAIKAANFVITESFVNQPSGRVRYAKFRQDYCALNKLLSQMPIEGIDTSDMLTYTDGAVYCIMLHGPDFHDRSKLGFVDWAFPDHNNRRYVDIFSLDELVVAARARTVITQVDSAHAKLKARKTGKGGTS